MFKKILISIKFIVLVSIFGKKGPPAKNIIIIDGPSSVSVSKRLSLTSDTINYFVPLHYMHSVLKSGLAMNLIIAPTFLQYIISFFYSISKLERRNISKIMLTFPAASISIYIKKHSKVLFNVLVFNERGPFACSAISAAKKYNIRTSCIQHGAIVENYFPINVDLYFTWSDYFGDVIKERCPHVMTSNVGRLDYIEPQKNLLNRLDLPLVALQSGSTSIPFTIMLENFVDVVEICLDVFNGVVLRRHPNDNISKELVSIFGSDKRISFDNDTLQDSLSKRKIVISLYSTILLEAATYGCLDVQYVSDAWYSPIFQRSLNVLNRKEGLKKFLEDIKKQDNFSTSQLLEGIIGRPNYVLFFDSLR